MWEALHDFADRVLGLNLQASDLHFSHMAARSLIVFTFAVLLARVGNRRMLGHSAGFDIMVAIILGSVLSRGINGQAAFFPSLGASALLVLLHHIMAKLSCHFHWFSLLVKGRPKTLIRAGKPDPVEMRRCSITHDDLDENLRLSGNIARPAEVAEARLERNGNISVVKASEGKG